MKPLLSPVLMTSIEPLEGRIAPATIFVGDPSRNDTEYADTNGTDDDPGFAPFVSTTTAGDPISSVLGADASVFYIKLAPGDRMVIFGQTSGGGTGYTNFITGPSGTGIKGNVVAVFQDKNGNNEVDANELVGMSLGNNVSVQVSGTVSGDVIANYNDATGSIGESSVSVSTAKDLLNNSISFFGATSVSGTIAAGGDIRKISMPGDAAQILTGSAVNTAEFGGGPLTFDLNGSAADGGDTLDAVIPVAGKRGPSISNVTIGSLVQSTNGLLQTKGGILRAGDGGPQAAGGNVSNITLISDTTGWTIQAGAGGDGTASAPKGGAGGKVSSILANGLDETQVDGTLNSVVQVLAGRGGNAFGSTAAGGKGGDINGVSIGYEKAEGVVKRSVNPISDSVLLKAGDGGSGKIGGAGGNILNDKVFAAPTLAGNDLALRAGLGGASTVSGGRAGIGGSIKNVDVLNPEVSASRAILDAGDGGSTAGVSSAGAKGGSVSGAKFFASSVAISAGDGSMGTVGGAGGSITNVVAAEGFQQGVRANNFSADAGVGGIGSSTRGGAGGAIKGITLRNADLAVVDINQTGLAGNGGNSKSGPGGKGGSVSNLDINDVNTLNEALVRIRAGNGGNGGDLAPTGGSGGVGGSISGQNIITGFDISLSVTAGTGGSAPFKGKGAAGGSINNFAFVASGQVGGIDGSATLAAGVGGVGIGPGAGGKGGSIGRLEVIADGVITANAGVGGNGGATGASGSGGGITASAFSSAFQSVFLTGGNAGTAGTKKAGGGGISGTNVLGANTIDVRAGNGFAGGAGGNINNIGVFAPGAGGGPGNTGPSQSLTMIAGNGSGLNNVAGNGGSISNVDGYIAMAGMTLVQGGTGGAGTTKTAAGGSITEVNFLGGGSATAEVRIEAGNATDAPGAAKGGAGGKVKGIGMGLNPASTTDPFSIHPGTIIRHIAAGNGGAASVLNGVGGAGGSVDEVRVNHDIGVRSGAIFGFNTMGGIFAGTGGIGAPGKSGLAGSVTNISADGIAAILAGRLNNGDVVTEQNLANVVTGIILNGSSAATVNGSGTYLNFDASNPALGLAKANVLGAVVNPTAAGVAYPAAHPHANTFDLVVQGGAVDEYVDNDSSGDFSFGDATNANTDGFVAARVFIGAKGVNNVRPEALLTLDPAVAGKSLFIDLNNTNGQAVILP